MEACEELVEACEQPVEDVAEEQLEVETLTVTEAPMMAAAGRPHLPDAPTGTEEFQQLSGGGGGEFHQIF